MKCPKCGGEDCHEFFNEPKEERETHFTVASVIFICVGVLAFVIAGVFRVLHLIHRLSLNTSVLCIPLDEYFVFPTALLS